MNDNNEAIVIWALVEWVMALITLLGAGQRELSTVFGSSTWDKSNPYSRLACYRREIDDAKDMLVAHNYLPCKSAVWLFNPRTGRSVVARVGDRGPRHAGIDLSRQVARRLAHNGREIVMVVSMINAPHHKPNRHRRNTSARYASNW